MPLEIEYLPPKTLKGAPYNPRKMPDEQMEKLMGSLREFGFVDPVLVNQLTGYIIGGHQRVEAAKRLGLKEVPVVHVSLDRDAEKALNIALNKIHGEWDLDALSDLLGELKDDGYDLSLTGFSEDELDDLLRLDDEPTEHGDPDAVVEPDDEPAVTQPGDLIVMGDHRLLCGDSTSPEDVARLMGDDQATMLHADPPYGMGKEKDGVANDNLYGPKLDAFQLAWYAAFRPALLDNASLYVWGNAEDLWRWWYVGGLKEHDARLSFRTEIVWKKPSAPGIQDGTMRQYPPVTERCLFWMLGEQLYQGNLTKDEFPDEWEPIRAHLEAEAKRMGWGPKDIQRLCGVGMYGHWFTKSQWVIIPEKHYRTLQDAANGQAFTRPWRELKALTADGKGTVEDLRADFYSGRTFFDNTHDAVTDVWEYPIVTGEERNGHPTPKPVALVERALLSSSQANDVIAIPFGGGGSDLIACQTTGRQARVMEIDPKWCDAIIARWEQFTGRTAHRIPREVPDGAEEAQQAQQPKRKRKPRA